MEIERTLQDKTYIVEMISNKQDSGFANTDKVLFGKELNVKLYYAVLSFLGAFIILLGLEFLKFLEIYKKSV